MSAAPLTQDDVYRRMTAEEKLRNALRVFEVQGAVLDRRYIETWAQTLGIEDLWSRLVREAKPL